MARNDRFGTLCDYLPIALFSLFSFAFNNFYLSRKIALLERLTKNMTQVFVDRTSFFKSQFSTHSNSLSNSLSNTSNRIISNSHSNQSKGNNEIISTHTIATNAYDIGNLQFYYDPSLVYKRQESSPFITSAISLLKCFIVMDSSSDLNLEEVKKLRSEVNQLDAISKFSETETQSKFYKNIVTFFFDFLQEKTKDIEKIQSLLKKEGKKKDINASFLNALQAKLNATSYTENGQHSIKNTVSQEGSNANSSATRTSQTRRSSTKDTPPQSLPSSSLKTSPISSANKYQKWNKMNKLDSKDTTQHVPTHGDFRMRMNTPVLDQQLQQQLEKESKFFNVELLSETDDIVKSAIELSELNSEFMQRIKGQAEDVLVFQKNVEEGVHVAEKAQTILEKTNDRQKNAWISRFWIAIAFIVAGILLLIMDYVHA